MEQIFAPAWQSKYKVLHPNEHGLTLKVRPPLEIIVERTRHSIQVFKFQDRRAALEQSHVALRRRLRPATFVEAEGGRLYPDRAPTMTSAVLERRYSDGHY